MTTKQDRFTNIIGSEIPVLVDFSAEWCGPCKMMPPILDELKSAWGDRVRIIKIDVDKNQQLAGKYKISGVPTLILFKKGEAVWRQSGVQPAYKLKDLLDPYINS